MILRRRDECMWCACGAPCLLLRKNHLFHRPAGTTEPAPTTPPPAQNGTRINQQRHALLLRCHPEVVYLSCHSCHRQTRPPAKQECQQEGQAQALDRNHVCSSYRVMETDGDMPSRLPSCPAPERQSDRRDPCPRNRLRRRRSCRIRSRSFSRRPYCPRGLGMRRCPSESEAFRWRRIEMVWANGLEIGGRL